MIAELDRLPVVAFADRVAPLFEGAPRFLARLAAARPFGDAETMFRRAESIALALPEEEAVELVDAHPRLGAPPGSVSAASFREQGYDRDTAGIAAERGRAAIDEELRALNDAYERRFGFRYCVEVAGRPRTALLPELRLALDGDRDAELNRALVAVVRIAENRYRREHGEAA